MGEAKQSVSVKFSEKSSLRDLWAKENLSPCEAFQPELMPHTVRILRSSRKSETVTIHDPS
ncbi:MAG: hypothetical protein IJC26_07960 [Clostridia bacterium]|nr:hypothetical protein [Clostridia bacterium]